MYLMIASRTRQWVSSARCSIAGIRLWPKRSMPMTWLICPTDQCVTMRESEANSEV